MFDLPKTSKFVKEYLESLNIEVHSQVGRSGVVGVIRGNGPCILLRADMDALAITEVIESDYKSTTPGIMHACGHDAHVAMLLVAAKVIAKNRDRLRGSVKFMFQPAEEGGHGAKYMIEDDVYPVLDSEPRVDEVYGIHMGNQVPLGDLLLSEKYMSCYSDFFDITITGRGGHASSPYLCVDPIITASELVLALQTIISRNINTAYKTVLTVTTINGGETYNAISDTCSLKGTLRAYETEVRDYMCQRIKEICAGIGQAYNCDINFKLSPLYGPIINEEGCIQKTLDSFLKISPYANRITDAPMIGEDFSYLTDLRPGGFYMLGCSTKSQSAPLHSPKFTFDERAMLIGASWHVQLIQDLLFN